jgi:hypothetical protein
LAAVTDEARLNRARANGLGFGAGSAGLPKRSRGRIVAGLTLVAVCGWVATAVFVSAGSRQEVLAVARPISRYDEVERGDLKVVRVAAGPEVDTVPADQLEELIGRRVTTSLVEGSLLQDDLLLDADARVVGDTEAVVSAVFAQEDAPATLSAGDEVELIVRSPAGSIAGPQTLPGWVLAVEDADRAGTSSQRAALVVRRTDTALVSAASAEQRVSVAVTGER